MKTLRAPKAHSCLWKFELLVSKLNFRNEPWMAFYMRLGICTTFRCILHNSRGISTNVCLARSCTTQTTLFIIPILNFQFRRPKTNQTPITITPRTECSGIYQLAILSPNIPNQKQRQSRQDREDHRVTLNPQPIKVASIFQLSIPLKRNPR